MRKVCIDRLATLLFVSMFDLQQCCTMIDISQCEPCQGRHPESIVFSKKNKKLQTLNICETVFICV